MALGVEDSFTKYGNKGQLFRLWAEVAPPVEGLPADWSQAPLTIGSHIVIFLKLFDIEAQTLRGINHVYMKKNDKVGDLIPVILAEMNWPANTSLKLYEVCLCGDLNPGEMLISIRKSNLQ